MKTESFYPYVLPEVIGCPDPTVNQAIVSAAAEFCRETLSWTEIQDPVSLVNGEHNYELDVPSQAYALTVRDVWLGIRRLQPITMQALQVLMPTWQTATGSVPTHFNSATERGLIRVFPIPNDVLATDPKLVIRAAYVPVLNATTIPDFLGQRHVEVIAAGAKARLMVIPGTAWSNPGLAGIYRTQFDAGIQTAIIAEAHDRVPGVLTVPARRFF